MNYTMISRKNLNKRICDIEEDSNIELTYRQFIRKKEEEHDMCPEPINEYGDTDLQEYLEELDY